MQDETQISLEIGFTQQLGISHLSVMQNLMNTYWLAKNLIATSKITDLALLTEYQIKSNLKKSYIFKESYAFNYPLLESLESSYSNTHAAQEFINAIGRVIEEAICQEIQESPKLMKHL
ncbi:10919_t:CDS:2 [Racocetra fulgida]|uniref:10919_t:CDS:1 n=1 Tax=Racocetra fulgida TaxID=60492 RepID=A0A9N9BC55_9GLOM|nr:10919_t:CDS:2 [Racocetra fulgida]